MPNSTIYDVKVRYVMEDKASDGLKNVAKHADRAHDSVFSLKHVIEGLAIEKVFHAGKEALIDFNNEMDSLKIGMTTVMQMNLHMPFEKASKEADKLFETFQALAKKSPVTTKEFMQMASAIAAPVAMAGGGPEKLTKLTQGAITASLAYGKDTQTTAMAIEEMLAGKVRKTNPLAMSMVGSMGMKGDEFNKLDQQQRAKAVEKMFTDPALLKAAERFGETFKGQTSTFKDNLQIALGQVGRPLMESMTAEVKKWNEWIEKHPKMIKETISELSDMISRAFEFVKNVGSWLVDNRDVIFSIAKTFLIFKGKQLAGDIFRKFADGLGNLTDQVKGAGSALASAFGAGGGGIGGLVSGAGGIFGLFGKAIPVVGTLITSFSVLSSVMDLFSANRKADMEAESRLKGFHEATGDLPDLLAKRKSMQEALQGKGPMGAALRASPELRGRYETELAGIEEKAFSTKTLGESLRKLSDEMAKISPDKQGFAHLTTEQFRQLGRQVPTQLLYSDRDKELTGKVTSEVFAITKLLENQTTQRLDEILKFAFPEQYGKPNMESPKAPEADWAAGGKPNVNITIQKIEVASEDPDRFVFGIVQIGEQATKHPTASQHTVPGGF